MEISKQATDTLLWIYTWAMYLFENVNAYVLGGIVLVVGLGILFLGLKLFDYSKRFADKEQGIRKNRAHQWATVPMSCFLDVNSAVVKEHEKRNRVRESEEIRGLIRPYSNDEIVALLLYSKQIASITDIEIRKTLLTLSSALFQFAIPKELITLNANAYYYYRDYLVDLETIDIDTNAIEEYNKGRNGESAFDRSQIETLISESVILAQFALRYAQHNAWVSVEEIVRHGELNYITTHEQTKEEKTRWVLSILTAYFAYAEIAIPKAYYADEPVMYEIYRAFRTALVFSELTPNNKYQILV